MRTLGRIVGVLALLAIGALVAWFAFARPMTQSALAAQQDQLAAAQVRADNAESQAKKLTDNPIVRTEVFTKEVPVEKVVEKIVEIKVPVDKIVEKVVEVTNPTTPTLVSTCRHIEWLQGAVNGTVGTSELVAVVDRDYMESDGAQWSEPGFTVPSGTIFWTDLFGSVNSLPAGVKGLRIQGGWGVYSTVVDYIVPKPNGGGRFTRICESVSDIKVSVSPVASANTAPVVTKPICVTPTEVGTIGSNGKAYDDFFEKSGWQYGKTFQNGDVALAGWLLHANSRVYKTNVAEKLPEGGRGMPICSK